MDEPNFRDRFNTSLAPADEAKYRTWLARQGQRTGRDMSRDTDDYDMRGFYKETAGADVSPGHFTDKFKKPNHPTFSTESIYAGTPAPGGEKWDAGEWGNGTFTPSLHMLARTHPLPRLRDYMSRAEPDTRLLGPTYPVHKPTGARLIADAYKEF